MPSSKPTAGSSPWLRISLIAAATTLLLMLLGWEVIEQQLLDDSHQGWVRYARWGTSAVAVGVVLAIFELRRNRGRAQTLSLDLERTEHELQATKNLLNQIVDAVPSSLLILDNKRRVRLANATARDIHALTDVGLAGQECDALLTGSAERCAVCPGCETLMTREKHVATGDITARGTGAVLSTTGYPIEMPDGADAALLVEEIITKQKKLQASLLHQEKMAAFGLVAAGVAHEMGNPLSAIEMHLQLLDDTSLSEEDADSVQTLRRETARLRRTLRELVDFARRRRSEATLVSVQSVINDAIRLIRFDRRMRDIETEVDADPDTPPVFIVEDHLTQVMVNLIINAIDAMPDGGKLKIDTRYVGKQVAIRVRDDGTGMSKATLERIFEPLYTTKELGKGTGLGLSICRDVLEAAGGTINLHSAPNKGTTAVITLPVQTAEEHASRPIRVRAPLPLFSKPTPEASGRPASELLPAPGSELASS